MNLLNELQEIIDKDDHQPTEEMLHDFLEINFSKDYPEHQAGIREYDIMKALYWYSFKNSHQKLIDEVIPNAKSFDTEDDKVKSMVVALQNKFLT